MPFTTLATRAQASLNALANAVSTVHPTDTRTFNFSTGILLPGQEPVALVQQFADWTAAAAGRYVYYLETDDDPVALTALHEVAK